MPSTQRRRKRIDRARAVKILGEIERRGIKLTKQGTEHVGPCPRCGGIDRFAMNDIKGVWNCRGCEKGGGVIELVQHLDGVDFNAAVTTLAGPAEPRPDFDQPEVAFDYHDGMGKLIYQNVRLRLLDESGAVILGPKGKPDKTLRQRLPGSSFEEGLKGIARVPYHLPQLREALAAGPNKLVFFVEGEGKADLLWSWGLIATSVAKGTKNFAETFRGTDVVVLPDNDKPGQKRADFVLKALTGIAARLRVLPLPGLGESEDIKDWAARGGTAEKLLELVNQVPDRELAGKKEAPTDNEAATLLAELSKLSRFDYDRRRREAAKELGITVGTLDKVIAEHRARESDDRAELPHWKVEPWKEPVDLAQLLNDIVRVFNRYAILPKHAPEALALWVLHAWAFDAWDISPFMVLVSPEKRCGKTTILIILQYLTPRSELASNLSASAIFRYIEEQRPTLLIDEADTFVKDNEEMRGVLNSGHTKTAAYVIRTVEIGGEHKAKRFSTWAPKAIATIRVLADTLEDRAVIVTMMRKKKSEKVERLRRCDNQEFAEIRQKAVTWTANSVKELAIADPEVSDRLNDRAADNWRPLVAIANLAGGDWPKRALAAALALSGGSDDSDSIGTQLLADIRPMLDDQTVVGLTSETIIAELVKSPERPWGDWKNGKPITARSLAGLLRSFKIFPQQLQVSVGKKLRGYARFSLEEAFSRYLPDPQSVPSVPSPTERGTSSDFSTCTRTAESQPEKTVETAAAVGQDTQVHFENDQTELRTYEKTQEIAAAVGQGTLQAGNHPEGAGKGFPAHLKVVSGTASIAPAPVLISGAATSSDELPAPVEGITQHMRQVLQRKVKCSAEFIEKLSLDQVWQIIDALPAEMGLDYEDEMYLIHSHGWDRAKLRGATTGEARKFIANKGGLPPRGTSAPRRQQIRPRWAQI